MSSNDESDVAQSIRHLPSKPIRQARLHRKCAAYAPNSALRDINSARRPRKPLQAPTVREPLEVFMPRPLASPRKLIVSETPIQRAKATSFCHDSVAEVQTPHTFNDTNGARENQTVVRGPQDCHTEQLSSVESHSTRSCENLTAGIRPTVRRVLSDQVLQQLEVKQPVELLCSVKQFDTLTESTVPPSDDSLPKFGGRCGYFMEPSIADMAQMDSSCLQHIEHLVIGRRGVGKIEFTEAVDVRGLNLESIIDINYGRIEVHHPSPGYPQDVRLKKKATLTFYDIYPTKNGKPVPWDEHDSVTRAVFSKFTEKLRNLGTFKSYTSKSGTWIFEVGSL